MTCMTTQDALKPDDKKSRVDVLVLHTMRTFYACGEFDQLIEACGELDTHLWEQIFKWFYGHYPRVAYRVPEKFHLGSADPLWDDLFFKKSALEAQRQVLLERQCKKQTERAA